jgi:hypothetical protein
MCRDSWSHVYTAKCVIPEGAELTITYGASKGNLALLSMYGFCLPGNLADRINLRATDQQEHWGLTNSTAADLHLIDPTAEKALAFCVAACPPAVCLCSERTSLDRQRPAA